MTDLLFSSFRWAGDFLSSSVETTKVLATGWIWVPIVNSFRFVYFNGPARLGFWHGVSAEEACAQMTRVPSNVWERESDACENLLSKDFRAMCIGVGLLGGVMFTWKLLDVWVWMCAFQQFRRVTPALAPASKTA